MKKKDVAQMIGASEVARLWNERARAEGIEAHYTRWTVYGQRDKLNGVDTPFGRLFSREEVMRMPLPRYRSRPDTAKRNQARGGKKRKRASSLPTKEGSEEPPSHGS